MSFDDIHRTSAPFNAAKRLARWSYETGADCRNVKLRGKTARTELSLFLAKLFGICLLIMAVLFIVRGEVVAKVIEEFFASRPMSFLSGLLALTVGIAMAVSHSVRELSWRGLITLFRYLSIAKGIVRVSFPEVPKKAADFIVKSSTARWL